MSTLKVSTIQNASGVEVYTCKAWVNFNGTGTVAIRAAGNVGSITDNGVGDYTVNFTNAMADANYSTVIGTSGIAPTSGNGQFAGIHETGAIPTASAARIATKQANSPASAVDCSYMSVSIFR